jgi:hypothetical protein
MVIYSHLWCFEPSLSRGQGPKHHDMGRKMKEGLGEGESSGKPPKGGPVV